jgi:Domain of Unknown Function (DUF1080)
MTGQTRAQRITSGNQRLIDMASRHYFTREFEEVIWQRFGLSDGAKLQKRPNMISLFHTRRIVVLGIGLIALAAGGVAYKLRGVLVPAAQALIGGIPIAGPQDLSLTDLPAGQGPRVSLFNGVDLNDWDGWLGYPDAAETFKKTHSVNPIGAGGVGKEFKVVVVDGEPAIYVNGRIFGSLTHKGDYADYHLTLQFKWGESTYYPKLNDPKDSGLLYHSHGAPGEAFGTWMRSVEFDIVHGQFGRLATVGDGVFAKTTVGRDADLLSPTRRYIVGGQGFEIPTGALWFAQNATDQEKPVGNWNTLELYVLGDKAVHVINGVPVLEAWNLCDAEHASARCEPLTHGRIQLQSEGSEAFFRRITLEPIKSLPKVTMVR